MLGSLRQVRNMCRLSQLELSLRLGVSQRHISFVESGRAKPSRDLLIAWLNELNTPLGLHNEIMLQAGYAPVYNKTQLDDPTLVQVNDALHKLMLAHDPLPALVIDAQWNLLRLNRGGQWLAALLMPNMGELADTEHINLLDMLTHPQGLTKTIINLHEVGPGFLSRLRREAAIQPSLTPKVEAFAELLETHLGAKFTQSSVSSQIAPVLTTCYDTKYGKLSFFSMFTTFGTPQDITLASLRVEHMFAADAETHQVLKEQIQ